MRLLFTSAAARPHVFPLIPLAWACRAAGHEVRVCAGASIADDIVHTGLPIVLAGGRAAQPTARTAQFVASVYCQQPWPADWPVNTHLLNDRQREHLERLGNTIIAGADAMAGDLVAFARWWRPDVVIYETTGYAGAVAAAVLGVPAVRYRFGSSSVLRLELRGDRPLPAYSRLFARFAADVVTEPAMTVDPVPPSMRLAEPALPWHAVRYLPYNGSGCVPRWLARSDGRPRVCVTWGHVMASALGGAAAGPYRQTLDAVAGLDVDVVVVASSEQLAKLGDLPSSVRPVEATPLNLVLPYCDVVVHQGGDGTTLTAAAGGLPQLAITRRPEAEVPSGRVAAAGAGLHLRYQELRHNSAGHELISTAVEKLLADHAYRDAAHRLRDEIAAQPPPSAVVPALVALAGQDRRVPSEQVQ
nr:nucleotide disphospho-sugar-binding domain-containing protein [Kibdelosporangium sp. MJ126-NF4]CEL17195.1 Glycosyltransferase [Kibdelosporangium sp. MJ126-NF4]CTQ91575.1 Glycosyltransferase [Kibdelosporangium sp. MJ126-NF4]